MAGAADQDGMARGLVDDVARRAGDAATWLDQRDPGSLLDEARGFARRRPGTFLAIAAGVGVLAGRLSRSLVDEARDSDDPSDATGRPPEVGRRLTNGASSNGSTGYGHHGGRLRQRGASAPPAERWEPVPTATTPRHPPRRRPRSPPERHPRRSCEGSAAVPGDELPDAHRTTQPIAPDGTPSPIDDEGGLTAESDDSLRGNR